MKMPARSQLEGSMMMTRTQETMKILQMEMVGLHCLESSTMMEATENEEAERDMIELETQVEMEMIMDATENEEAEIKLETQVEMEMETKIVT
eukprot:13540979-Ditylum_brightwellii.AAC.1